MKPQTIHTLHIPDDLLAWGLSPEVAIGFIRPWAHEVRALVDQSERDGPLCPRDRERLLARLEGLVREAIAAGRHELLLDLDIATARWLRLRYVFGDSGDETAKEISVGAQRNSTWSYAELRLALESPDPPAAMRAMTEVRKLLRGTFRGARVSTVAPPGAAPKCTGCGKERPTVTLAFGPGTEYCGACWSEMTADRPPIDLRRSKKKA
jgi:hypothetical protein